MKNRELVVATALSLYAYNVSPSDRARALYCYFEGHCLEESELVEILTKRGAYAATEFPYETAKLYVEQAMQRYGDEAHRRVAINSQEPS